MFKALRLMLLKRKMLRYAQDYHHYQSMASGQGWQHGVASALSRRYTRALGEYINAVR